MKADEHIDNDDASNNNFEIVIDANFFNLPPLGTPPHIPAEDLYASGLDKG